MSVRPSHGRGCRAAGKRLLCLVALAAAAALAGPARRCTTEGFCEVEAGMLHPGWRALWLRGQAAALVGTRGSVLRLVEGRWQADERVTAQTLSCVSGTGPDDVWAGGADGTVLHFDGARWSRVPVPTGANVTALLAVAPDDVWGLTETGGVLHKTWAGFGWAELPLRASWTRLLGTGPDDVYLVSAERVLFFDGARWRDLSPARLDTALLFGRRGLWNYSVDGSQRWTGRRWADAVADVPSSACPADDGHGHNFALSLFSVVPGEVWGWTSSCRGGGPLELRADADRVVLSYGPPVLAAKRLPPPPPGVRWRFGDDPRAALPWAWWTMWPTTRPQLRFGGARDVLVLLEHDELGIGRFAQAWKVERDGLRAVAADEDGCPAAGGACVEQSELDRWASEAPLASAADAGMPLVVATGCDAGQCWAPAGGGRAFAAPEVLTHLAVGGASLWALGASGALWRFGGERFQPAGFELPTLVDLQRGPDGTLWALGGNGELFFRR